MVCTVSIHLRCCVAFNVRISALVLCHSYLHLWVFEINALFLACEAVALTDGVQKFSTSVSVRSMVVPEFRQCHFTSTESVRTIRDEEPRTSTSTSTQLLTSVLQCCFTSTETISTVRYGEPRTATSTFCCVVSGV